MARFFYFNTILIVALCTSILFKFYSQSYFDTSINNISSEIRRVLADSNRYIAEISLSSLNDEKTPKIINSNLQNKVNEQKPVNDKKLLEKVVSPELISIKNSNNNKVKPIKNDVETKDTSTRAKHMNTGKLLKCNNQTACIQPILQLQKIFKVYYCKHVGYGVRFYYLIREGLLLHPYIQLVNDPNMAEIIVYLPVSANWDDSECSNPLYRNKTVVLDEGDYPQLFQPPGTPNNDKWALYFKRSYVRRNHGIFEGYMGYLNKEDVLPMTYTILEAYVRTIFNRYHDRHLDIVCTLRGGPSDPARDRVRSWVDEYGKNREIKNYRAGEVNHLSRTVVSTDYLKDMHNAKIIVTSNPSGWEGDFRLMEAIASGALIFVDYMYVPRPYPLVDNVHIIYYDNNNKTDLYSKLDYYRSHPNIESARRIAVAGYIHSMTYHRAANLIDYVFRTLHLKLLRLQIQSSVQGSDEKSMSTTMIAKQELNRIEKVYHSTGYDMQDIAREKAKQFLVEKKNDKENSSNNMKR